MTPNMRLLRFCASRNSARHHRSGPFRGDDEEYELAALGGSLQCGLPSLPGLEPALRIEIEEHIVPTHAFQPVAQGDGFSTIEARMADENAGHSAHPPVVARTF
jgi:hypothetical protein